jgi:branched-subunit amino acid ABC-type transport system permease component
MSSNRSRWRWLFAALVALVALACSRILLPSQILASLRLYARPSLSLFGLSFGLLALVAGAALAVFSPERRSASASLALGGALLAAGAWLLPHVHP